MENLLIFFLGTCVGLFSSILGVGGGIVIVPLLPLISSLSFKETIATSLTTIGLVVFFNFIIFAKKKLINYSYAFCIGFITALSSFFAVKITIQLSEENLVLIVFLFLLLVTIINAIKAVKDLNLICFFSKSKNGQNIKVQQSGSFNFLFFIIISVFTGTMSGLTGIGGGIIVSIFLLNFSSIEYSKITPTTNFIMFLASLSGFLSFVSSYNNLVWPYLGIINLKIVLIMFLGAICTALLGQRVQHLVSKRLKVYILLSFLFIICLKMFYQQ